MNGVSYHFGMCKHSVYSLSKFFMNYPKKALIWDIFWLLTVVSEWNHKIVWWKKVRTVICFNSRTLENKIYIVNDLIRWNINWTNWCTHNMYGTRIYKKYFALKDRCNNKNNISYKNYWWRWIKCEWENFEQFYKDMSNSYIEWYSLDRMNNNGNYSKENCRWASRIEQANNKRTNIFFTYNWESKTLKNWCDILWLKYKTVFARIKYQWKKFEDAIK